MRIRYLIAVVSLFLGLVAFAPTMGLTQDGISPISPEAQRMTDMVAACGDVAPNTLCSGGGSVALGLTGGREASFERAGERRSLFDVESVQTVIDAGDCKWGGIVMNVQGSLPLSQPGITFIALGNVTVENATLPETLFQAAQALTIDLPSRVNIRAQPSLDADILTTTGSSTSLPADALSADGAWVRVQIGEQIAWVFRELVTSASDLSALPTLSGDARGWMQAFTVRTEATPCDSQMPSLLLIQTPDGIPVPLTINGSEFTVGSTIVLTRFSAIGGSTQGLFGSDGGAGNPQGDLIGGDTAPPEPDYESLFVLEGDVAAVLADGSVMPIAPGCAFQTLMADGSVLPQEDRLVLDNPSLDCGSDNSLTGSDGGLDSSFFGLSGIQPGGLGLLVLLNDLLLVDISAPIPSMSGYVEAWEEINSNEASWLCAGFEGISPQSGSILLAPSPQDTSQLTLAQLTFIFPLVPPDFTNVGSVYVTHPISFDASFILATENDIKIAFEYDQDQVAGHAESHGHLIKSITLSYDYLIEWNLITEGQTEGMLVWWAQFDHYSASPSGLFPKEEEKCVTDLYTLHWSNTPGERTSQSVSTAVHNFPTPANTPGATDHPLTILGASATPPFTLPSPTVVQPTNVPPTNVAPTNVPPTANPDRDGDGVVNEEDGCPDEAGPRENGGCPLPPPPPDADGDGVPDEVDLCPGIPGPADNRGCPSRS